uniref:USP domain-containing protein n=1 Tax=Globodera rostochiensis TaxID=31243 RepID=A0A914I5X4_GLORO
MADTILTQNAEDVDLDVCWSTCHLDGHNCLAHTAPKRKRKNCTENPFCIHRLGLELLDKLSESLKAPKVLVRRDSSRQPCGLTNAGNFCYVNIFLQTWFNDLKFRQCIYNWRPSENWTKPPTARLDIEATMNCLQQLFITMQFTPFESTDAGAFIELLRLDDRQQDVLEFHTRFFDKIKDNLDSHPNGRPILDVIRHFQSRINQTIFCANCNRTSVTAGEDHALQIAIDGHQSLISAIQSFFAPEPLTDYRCEQCGLRGRVTRTANFTQLPEVLIIQLTRYVVGSNGRVRKLPHAVQYPRILAGHELQQDVVGAADYKLCAVMIHQGQSMNSGHYYDIIRDPIIGKWFSYNDATVTEKPAPGYSGVLTKKPKATADTKGCYALIYRKAGSEPTGPVQSPANDVLTNVKNKLEEDFSRKHKGDGAAFGVWKKLIGERRVRLRELWSELEVHNGPAFVDHPEDITFLPTTLLSDILAKEHTAFEECKSVDSKYATSRVSAVAIPLCEHSRIIPGPLNRGALKAVNTLAAQRLIREYKVKLTTRTGADLCLDCVRRLRAYYVSRFAAAAVVEEGFFYPDGANIYIELKSDATNNKAEAVTDQPMDWVTRRESRQEKAAKKLIKIKMCSDETINDLKVRIFEQTQHPLASQLLYCGPQMLNGSWTLERAQVPANNHDAPLILHVQEQDGGEDEDEQNAGTTGGGFGHTALRRGAISICGLMSLNAGFKHVVVGTLNSVANAHSVGAVDGINFIACAIGLDVYITTDSFERVQTLSQNVGEFGAVTAVNCCNESGRIAICHETKLRLFEPSPGQQINGEKLIFPYRWFGTQNWDIDTEVDNVQWILGGLRLLVFAGQDLLLYQHKVLSCAVGGVKNEREKRGVKFTLTPDYETVWEIVWTTNLANRVKHVRVSSDGALFATCGHEDPLVKIWYQLKESNSFSFIYVQHPASVRGFEWRRSGGYFMPKRWAQNALITWCDDNTARIWKETPSQDAHVELHFISTIDKVIALQQEREQQSDNRLKKHPKMAAQMKRAKSRLMHKMGQLINEKRKVSADSGGVLLPTGPTSDMLRSPTFADFSVPTYTSGDTLEFNLVATINAENDCFLVPSLNSLGANSENRKGRSIFSVHWLNNKEHRFILGTQQLLVDALPFSGFEHGVKDLQVLHSLHSSTSSAGIAANPADLLDIPSHHHTNHPPTHSITSPNLSKTATTTEEMPSAKDLLDYKLEMLLRQWNRSSDLLFAIHPLDGSLMTWTLEWLDDAWKQPTVSFASRLPDAFPLAEAALLSIWLNTLHPSSQYGFNALALSQQQHHKGGGEEDDQQNPFGHFHTNKTLLAERNDVCLLTKHDDNHSLNLWRFQIDEQNDHSYNTFGGRRTEQPVPFSIASVLHEFRLSAEQKLDGSTLLEVLNNESLFDASALVNPLLPQYHPVQLVGLLNSGRIQRVKAILLNILRSLCQRQQGVSPWFKLGKKNAIRQRQKMGERNLDASNDVQKRRNSISVRASVEADGGLDYDDLATVNPLPLYALLAADKATDNNNTTRVKSVVQSLKMPATGEMTDSDRVVYDALFASEYVEEDLDLDIGDVESFSMTSRKQSLGRTRKISSGSLEIRAFASSNPNASPPINLTAKHSRLLTEMLTHIHLPGLSSVDQMHLLAVADTISHFSTNAMVDRLTQANAELQPIIDRSSSLGDSAASGYAVSGSGIETVDECATSPQSKGNFDGIHNLGVPFEHRNGAAQLHPVLPASGRKNNATLRNCMERVAKNAFQKEQEPMDAALFYLAMRKKNVLTQLFKTVNDSRMFTFFREDFSLEKWKKAALKNAFVLMSKQRFQHAAAFFLLGGSLKDAIQTILNRIGDIQLAMVVIRFYEPDSERQLELLTELLCREVLGCEPSKFHSMVQEGKEKALFTSASRDPFERSMALWIMNEYALSAATLLEEPSMADRKGEERRGSLIKDLSTCGEIALPDIFNFYSFLRRHPLVIRQKLAKAGISTTSTEHFLTWTHRIGAKLSAGERQLYFRTASSHLSAGCPLLALDVLSRMPVQIDEEEDDVGKLTEGLSDQTKKEDHMHKEEVDWSSPVNRLGDMDNDDKLELKWSDIEEWEGGKDGVNGSKVVETELLRNPTDDEPNSGTRATLSIITDELNTLVVGGGYEVAGGQLRLELFSWLERECVILHNICDIQGEAPVGFDAVDTLFVGPSADGESSSYSASISSASSLVDDLKQQRDDSSATVDADSAQTAENSRLIAVQMELLLLLLEVQQNDSLSDTQYSQRESLPGIHSFPLLVSSISSTNASASLLTSPLRFMVDQYATLIHSINELSRPPQIDSDKTKLQNLFNLSQVLSLCVYQSLSDVENLAKNSFSNFSGPLTQPLRRYSNAGGKVPDDEVPVTSLPSHWPGVSNLVALLSRERIRHEKTSPNLRLLLVEFFVAIALSIFCHAFAFYDSHWLFRLCAHPMDVAMFSLLFGGGGERRLRSAVPARPPPPMRASNVIQQEHQPTPKSTDQDEAAIRAKLHAKVFRIEAPSSKANVPSSGRQQHSEQIIQCWVPPRKHIVQYLAEKVVLDGATDRTNECYNSDDETPPEKGGQRASVAEEEEAQEVLPHDASNGYAWTLMRLAIVRHVQHKLRSFVEMVGFDLQEIAHISPKLNLTLKRLNSWASQLEDELEGWKDGCPSDFLPHMSPIPDVSEPLHHSSFPSTSTWSSPLLYKYRVLLEPGNSPFEYIAPGVRAVRRLWNFLVVQENLAPIFVRYTFGKTKERIASSVTKNADANSILSVVKLIHREHDPIVAFAINSTRPGFMELSIERVLDEHERVVSRLQQYPSTSSFLLGQNRAEDNDDYQLLIPGNDNKPGKLLPAQTSSHLRKRPISGVRRLEAHCSLPYYVSGSSDGSIILWEWGVEQPVFIARVTGQFAKVAKLSFSQNGARFAAVDGDGLLCIWQAQPGVAAKKPYFSQKCHNKFASDVKFLGQTSTLLVTAGHSINDQNIVLWDTLMPQSKSTVHSFVGHPDGAYCVAYQPNTQSIISGGKHGEICIWDVRQRQLRATLRAFDNAGASVRSICLDPSGDTIAAGSSEGDIKIWSSATVVPQLLYSLPTEHAARSGFSLRQVASVSIQGVQQINIDSRMNMCSCGADNSLKLRIIPSFSTLMIVHFESINSRIRTANEDAKALHFRGQMSQKSGPPSSPRPITSSVPVPLHRSASHSPSVLANANKFLSDRPQLIDCPRCKQHGFTELKHVIGLFTWVSFLVLLITGLFVLPLFFLWVPFFIDTFKDVEHRCPNCKTHIGTFRRLGK